MIFVSHRDDDLFKLARDWIVLMICYGVKYIKSAILKLVIQLKYTF